MYPRAEPLLLRALEIRRSLIGENNLTVAKNIKQLAEVYFKMDDYVNAETYFLHSLDIHRDLVGENHIDYLNSLTDLTKFYEELGI